VLLLLAPLMSAQLLSAANIIMQLFAVFTFSSAQCSYYSQYSEFRFRESGLSYDHEIAAVCRLLLSLQMITS
jgi:hypothetical protein